MKRIVLCSDGTGNTVNKGRGTNVWKLYEAVDIHGHEGNKGLVQQVVFYDDGVGTESLKPLRLLSGALGLGLSNNVRQLYTKLCRVYEPGDEIYLFGFSRGAFTVRTLAGLIGRCGIVKMHPEEKSTEERTALSDKELKQRVKNAYGAFRKHFRRPWNQEPSEEARKATDGFRKKHAFEAKVTFIGVWDTVDAVGLPIAGLADALNCVVPFKFPDRTLGTHVKRACHAIAVDEERQTFEPLMWDESEEKKHAKDGKVQPGRIEQVWFAGVHSNVGGGYPKHGISLVALRWMMEKAKQDGKTAGQHDRGLRFLQDVERSYDEHANVNDKLYDSRAGFAVYYRYWPRDIAEVCRRHSAEPKIHDSVLDRIELGTDDYAPGNLPGKFTIVPHHQVGQTERENRFLLQDRIPKRLRKRLKEKGAPLLQLAKPWIRLRVALHYLLLVATLGALVIVEPTEAPGETAGVWVNSVHWAAGFLPEAIGGRVYALLTGPYGLAILGFCVLLYGASQFARSQMAKRFSEYWRGAPPERKEKEDLREAA